MPRLRPTATQWGRPPPRSPRPPPLACQRVRIFELWGASIVAVKKLRGTSREQGERAQVAEVGGEFVISRSQADLVVTAGTIDLICQICHCGVSTDLPFLVRFHASYFTFTPAERIASIEHRLAAKDYLEMNDDEDNRLTQKEAPRHMYVCSGLIFQGLVY